MAVTYLRLFDPTQQFQLKNGAINVAGLLKVKLEGTDDWAPVFDEDGTQLQQPVILDNNGRSKGLFVDASKVYWLEVDDRDGYELFTIRKMAPCGGGSGSSLGATYDVQSTDGTVNVTRYDNGGTVTFDLSIATVNGAAKWGATFGTASSISAGDIWEQVPAWMSAGSVAWNNGWEATKDCVADIAASLEMTSGDGDAISTFDVRCDFSVDGTVVSTEYGMLDPSDNTGRVTFEYKGALTEGQKIDCRFSVKSVEAMDVALAARAYYNEECDGVVGGDDQGATYIPGDYVEITTADVINVTGLQPVSGMSSYVQQSSFSSISSVVSSIQNDTGYISSVVSGITGDFTGYVPYSALSGDGTKITGIDGSAIGGTDYSAGEYIDISGATISVTGLQPVSGMSSYVEKSAFEDCCSAMSGAVSSLQVDVSGISSVVSGLTGQTGDYVEKSAISSQSGIWNEASGMSGKLDNSASSTFYPMTGNPSGFLTEHQDLSGYVEKSSISAQSSQWNEVSGLSGKLDNSASSLWYPMTGNPSGFLTAHQDLSGYVPVSAISAESSTWNSASAISAVIPWSALEGTGTTITAISGSSIGGSTSTGGKTYSGIDPIVVDNTADTISVKHSGLTVDETMTAYIAGTDIVIGVNTASFVPVSATASFVPVSATASFVQVSAISAASANWNDISSLSAYVAESAISAESSIWNSASAISAVIPWSALSGNGTSITGISGSAIGATGDYVEKSSISAESSVWNSASAISAVIPWSALSGDGTKVTGISGSAIGATGDYVEKSATEVAIGSANSAITDSLAQGSNNTASSYSLAQGTGNVASSYSFAQGVLNSARLESIAQGNRNGASSYSFAQGSGNRASSYSFAQGSGNRASSYSFAQGSGNLTNDYSFAQGIDNSASSYSFAQGSGNSAKFNSFAQGSGNSASSYSFAQGLGIRAKNTAAAFGRYNLRDDGSTITTGYSAAFVIGDGTAGNKRHDLMVVTKNGEITMFSSTADTTGTGIMSAIRAISAAATGGVDSATVSAIASSYAESAASGKLDSSASSSFYTTANESGFITGVDLSPYQTTAGMTAYQPSGDYIYASSLGTGTI